MEEEREEDEEMEEEEEEEEEDEGGGEGSTGRVGAYTSSPLLCIFVLGATRNTVTPDQPKAKKDIPNKTTNEAIQARD